MDEPPEALYKQWIKDRIEYYKRVEPVAPPRDEQLDLGPPVARLRVSHSNDRGAVGQMIGATPQNGVAEGQPFFLTLISRLAKASGDPDWKYPLTLQEGVPIGVDEPTKEVA